MNTVTAKETIGAGEAARRLGISAQYLSALAERGLIPFERTPYGRTYDARDVEEVRAAREARKH
jgi:excisionase family DNA binding protein